MTTLWVGPVHFGDNITVTHPFIAIPTAVAAMLVAWQIIWKRGLVPLGQAVHGVIEIAAATPTLVDIAHEFQPNAGGTLRDAIDRIEGKIDLAAGIASEWIAERDRILHRLTAIETKLGMIEDAT